MVFFFFFYYFYRDNMSFQYEILETILCAATQHQKKKVVQSNSFSKY